MTGNKISIVKIVNNNVKHAVYSALELINAKDIFSKPDLKILIKPNLLLPKEPDRAVTTHPEVFRAVVQWVKQFNPKKIIVAESSGTRNIGITEVAFKICGLREVCEDKNIEWIPFEETELKKYKIKNPLVLNEVTSSVLLEEVDIIINMPKIKTHGQCLLTCSIKNMFGTLILGDKAKIHAKFPHILDFSAALADIYSKAPPQLTLIDGYLCQEGQGPTYGDVVKMNLILAGYDGVALDTVVCKIIGFDPLQVYYLKMVEKKGLGTTNLEDIEFFGEDVEKVSYRFKSPKLHAVSNFIPIWLVDYVKKFLFRVTLRFNQSKCKFCATCWENCPKHAIKPSSEWKERMIPKWYKKECIYCQCCVELCPHNAVEFKTNFLWSFLARIRILFNKILKIVIFS